MKPTPVDERKDAVEDAYALTPLQEGILFHVLAAPDSGVYLSQAVFSLEGPDPEAFAAAWQRVVDRHPILRTAFAWQATERPLQVVGREVRLPFEVLDWRGEGPVEIQERLRSFLLADRKRGFNLSRAPMLRVAFIRQDAARALLVWTFHHLLLDGWSVALVLKEMVDTYEALRAGRDLALSPARPYREYIQWLSRQDPAQAEAFWKRRLGGFVSPTRLDLGRPAGPPPAGESFDRRVAHLSAGESEGLLALARRGQVTLNTLFQGAWAMALSRLSGEDDVVFGNTLSGRPADLPGVESMIGLFINTLPTRVLVRSSEPLLPFLRRLQDEYAELRQFEWSPLVSVQGWSDVPRGVALFETLFAFENYPMPDLGVARAGAAAGPGPWATGGVFLDNSHYPFSLAVRPDRQMSLHALFDRERFDPAAVDRVLARLQTLLAGMVGTPEGRVGALPFLTDAERRRSVLVGVTGEGVTGPKATREGAPSVIDLFRESARRAPGQVAVVDEGGSISFADLDRESDHLARMLLARGVGADDVVGVCAPRSAGLVASVLGVVKAGAAYLPLDPAHPAERKRLMLEDARVQVVICTPGEGDAVRGAGRTLILLEGGRVPLGAGATDTPLPPAPMPDALAYVIYTSGSTGRPKGVEVPHRGLANLVTWHLEAYGLRGGDRCTLVASPAFDASVWEVWPALAAGATLHVPDDDTRRTAKHLAEWLKDRAITHCFLPTPLAEAVLEEPLASQIPLRALLTGGDLLHRRAGESLPFRLVNHYGPTENAVVATCADVRRDQPFDPPIGLPIPGTTGYVLDGELRFVPEGVPGELFLGGVAVARGYRGRSDFTAERFLPDPFASAPGGRMYRTGDRVRVLADGNLEFLGRVDEQVKLQGHRIEPGEVEAALAGLPFVREAAVVARKSAGDGWRLVGYVSLRDGHDFDPRALRAELLHTLPEYMVPAVFVPLDRLPLSSSGKVDRRALPEPPDEAAGPGGNDGAPRNALEAGLAEIWSRVLNRPVSIHDGFFALGGHSLLATRVMSQVRRTYGVDLPLRALFEAGSVAELARRIEDARRDPGRTLAPALVASARDGDIPLSFAQQRLWFLDRMGAGAAYNIPWALRLRGALDVEALRGALRGLSLRHEALRTTFPEVAGRAVQRVSEAAVFPMRETDLGALPALDREREARRLASEEASRPFDLAQGPLVRACLLRLADQDHVLLVSIHHILADGWSMGVLTRELAALYREGCPGGPAANLPPLPVQYADFARWQRDWLQGKALAEQVAYWRKHLGDEPPRLELPLDRPRPREQTFRGGRHLVVLPEELSKRLATLCRQEGVTLFMALLAGWSAVLARWSGQDEVVVGSPIANRNRAEIEGLIGFFVNSLVLRTSLRGDPSFRDLLGRVKDAALGAYDHQDLPFEKLVEELHPGRNLDRNPLFQVVFAVQNAPFEALELPGLTLEAFERELGTSRFDLETHVFEQRGRQAALFNYNADLFDAATIERLAAHWLSLLGAAVAQPAARVLSLPLVAANDRAHLAELGRGPRPAAAEESTVAAAFAVQATLTPDAVAARFDGKGMTYAELDQRSRRIARLLRLKGAGPGALVGICLERSFDLLAGLLGILRSGAAYLPLDPDYPKDRLAFMVEDASPKVLLVEPRHVGLLPEGGIPVVVLEGDAAALEDRDTFVDASGSGDDLAYVTYTSGSTGRPKGVEVTQRGVIRLVKGADYAAFGPEETVLHLAPVSFDASTFEIWGPLLNGGTVVLFPERVPTPRDLGELIRREGVTTMWLTASLFNVIVDEEPDVLRPLRQLLIGGEALSVPHVRRAQERLPHTKIINGYGPTENTTFTCCHPIAPLGVDARAVPIGRPIARTDVYVVEDHGALCPAGVPGELLIGGEGLARGYLGRPDLTAERFVPDPFGTRPGARLYRTGDRVRWQTSGALEFLGRRDHQVKLRGFRIELGEIQAVLAGHADVGEAAVVVREGGSAHERRLVAFVVPASAAPKPGPQPGAPGGEVEDRIAQWREVYDSVIYGQLDAAGPDPTLNLSGWNSTYTGVAIPEAEMREQVDQAVERILATAPRRVLEIGCGTGLLLARIAPSCSRYVATDFSAAALAHVRALRPGLPGGGAQVEVMDRRADDFGGFEPGDFDVVVLNSIVQYFPDAAYLRSVLEGSLRVLAPGGRVFVGDVRHLPLLETFAASVAAHEAGATVSREWLREKTRERLASEQELVVSPRFFAAFAAQAPGDVALHVTPKRGRVHNELTRYRYDVILEAGLSAAPAPMTWLDWDEDDLSLPELRRLLSETGAERLGVRGVPNARTFGHSLLARWLSGGEEEAPPPAGVKGGVDPEDLWALSRDLPYVVDLSLAAGLPEGRFDVMLRRRPLRETLPPFEPAPLDPAAPDTNDPLTSTRVRGLVPQLRRHLQERLPEYMVPSAFVLLEALPLGPNGKVDVSALQRHEVATPQSEVSFEEPGTPLEVELARVFADVLGLSRVGALDNFFDLGGDSILAIQIVARANQAGIRLTPKQIFQAQTVSALARVAGRVEVTEAEQGLLSGHVPLTPIQAWYFEVPRLEVNHFNQSILLECAERMDEAQLEAVADDLEAQHDGLRSRCELVAGAWHQVIAKEGGGAFVRVDLSEAPLGGESAAVVEAAEKLQRSLDLARGPVWRLALLDLGPSRAARLLVLGHHLVVDGVSWRTLLEDLEAACSSRRRGLPVRFPPKTTSFRHWAQSLRRLAETPQIQAELPFWRGVGEGGRTPLGSASAPSAEATSTLGASASLRPDETRELLQDVPRVYHTQVVDALAYALVRAFSEVTGGSELLVDFEGHGREDVIAGVDLSRTVGWFTTLYPVRLRHEPGSEPGAGLMAAKERLRAIPGKGLGYGLLRYLDDSAGPLLAALPQSEVSFNYLGQFDQAFSRLQLFRRAGEGAGSARADGEPRRHPVEIGAAVVDGVLSVTFTAPARHPGSERLPAWAAAFVAALRALLEHCRRPDAGGHTPSDFPLAGVDQATLDRILAGARDVENVYPLSPMQEGMLFHSLLEEGGSVYTERLRLEIHGRLDPERLARAWQHAVDRHGVLRTRFVWEGLSRPLQVVERHARLPFALVDLRHETPEAVRDRLDDMLHQPRAALDPARAPLTRVSLVRTGEEVQHLVWEFHHMVLDGWCLSLVLKDAAEAYEALERGTLPSAALPTPYADYVAWLLNQDLAKAEEYWRKQLGGFEAATPLPRDARPGASPTAEAEARVRSFYLSAEATAELRALGRRLRVTLSTIVEAAWAVVLSRWSGERDVTFGVNVSGRPAALPGVESMVGLFVNTLPLRVRVPEAEPLSDWLLALQEHQVEQRHFEWSPLVKVQAWAGLRGGQPLFASLLAFENYPVKKEAVALGSVAGVEYHGRTNYPLSLIVGPGPRLHLRVTHDPTRFDDAAMDAIERALVSVLEEMPAQADRPVGELRVVGKDEEDATLALGAGPARAWGAAALTLHGLFEGQVDRTPDAEAVRFEGRTCTYRELDAAANRLAHRLLALGVRAETRVGLYAARSLEMVVGLLGILKAGGAYVPLEPEYPPARLGAMCEDAGVAALVVQEGAGWDPAPGRAIPTFSIGPEILLEDGQAEAVRPRVEVDGRNLAYVIFTSGSTGRPKGAMNAHAAVVNRILWMQDEYRLGAPDAVLQKTPFGFDVSVWEFFWPLAVGARLVVARPEGHRDPAYLARLIEDEGVTTTHFVPAMLRAFLAEPSLGRLPGLRLVVCSGEALPFDLQEAAFERLDAELHNLYGPTEAAVDVTHWACRRGDARGIVPIGRAIANTRAVVLDSGLRPVPAGASGELFLGGCQVGRGYVGRPDLTAERFVPDPSPDRAGARLYRTGDRVRMLADGALEYLGRLDHQVKIRGHRVELGEIEAELIRVSGVSDCVVVAREDPPGTTRLVAYVVGDAKISEARASLKRVLPEAMVPAAFVALPALPLGSNGKLDRKALPAPSGVALEAAFFEAPRTTAEATIARIWREVLGLEQVGIRDNFFDVGGHSLSLLEVHARLKVAFPESGLRVVDLFRYSTVEAVAERLAGGSAANDGTEPDRRAGRDAGRERLARRRARRTGGSEGQ